MHPCTQAGAAGVGGCPVPAQSPARVSPHTQTDRKPWSWRPAAVLIGASLLVPTRKPSLRSTTLSFPEPKCQQAVSRLEGVLSSESPPKMRDLGPLLRLYLRRFLCIFFKT